MRKLSLFAALACLLGLSAASSASAKLHVDRSFGDGGVVALSFPSLSGGPSSVRRMAVGPDGSLFFLNREYDCRRPGSCIPSSFVSHLGPRGEAVPGFAPASLPGEYQDLAVDRSGRTILAVGGPQLVISRIDAAGAVDTSFGELGTLSVPCNCLSKASIEVDESGRTLIVAPFDEAAADAPSPGLEVVRLTAEGALDPSFGVNGVSRVRVEVPVLGRTRLSVGPRGSITYVGTYNEETVQKERRTSVSVVRLGSKGGVDVRFGKRASNALSRLLGKTSAELAALVPRRRGAVDLLGRISPSHYPEWSGGRGFDLRLARDGSLVRSYGLKEGRRHPVEPIQVAASTRSGRVLAMSVLDRVPFFFGIRADGRVDHSTATGGEVEAPEWPTSETEIEFQSPTSAVAFDPDLQECRSVCQVRPRVLGFSFSGR